MDRHHLDASEDHQQDGGGLLKKRLSAVGREELERIGSEPDKGVKPDRTIKLSKAVVDRLPFELVGQRRYYDAEDRGFGVCVGKRTKTYFAERSIRGRGVVRRITIGKHGLITAESARQEAKDHLRDMEKRIDPLDKQKKEQEERRKAERENISLQNLWDAFQTDRRHTMKESTVRGYRNYIESVFSGKKVKRKSGFSYENWMERPIKGITIADVRTLHRLIREKSGPAYANGAMRVLSALMGFAESQEWIEKNPVKGLRRKGWFKVKACDGRITDDKLPAWFKAVDDFRYSKFDRPGQFGDGCDDPLGRVGADYLEFVVLTGLRRNEAARLTWDGIDFEKRTITIADTKNSDPLTLPMTEVLTTLLERRRKDAGDSQWVFPSPAKKGIGKPLAEPRFAAEKIAEKSGIPHTIHDLRRTFTSVAARMAPYAVVKTLINHRAKTTGDPTMDHYVRLSVEDIRPHLESIHRFFMEKKAAGQGMKLAQATGA